MYMTQVYKYEKDGVRYVGGEVPDGATVIETMDILNAEDGYELWRKADAENMGNSVWLRNGDNQDNYIEKEIKEE